MKTDPDRSAMANKDTLAEISTAMKEVYGRDVSCYSPSFLESAVEKRRLAGHLAQDASNCERLRKDPAEADIFYRSLRVTFSRFFRDPMTFALLEQVLFPEIMARKAGGSEIRIWSAGCASGQEPYSLAMLLSDQAAETGKDIRYRIFATDIDDASLVAGKLGVYSREAVAQVQAGRLARYFSSSGSAYTINPDLRQHIVFSVHDLLDRSSAHPPESIYGDFDLVMCSNVLLYYSLPQKRILLDKLQRSIAPNGYLVTGETEKSAVKNIAGLRMVVPETAIFKALKKKEALA